MKNIFSRSMSLLLAIVVMLSLLPFSAIKASAAEQTDVPQNMWTNYALRSLEYLGYNLDQQKADGMLYKLSGNETIKYMPDPYVPYDMEDGIGCDGLYCDWVGVGGTGGFKYTSKTGLAPMVEYFQKYGFVCAGYFGYYIYNYLPNIEGVNMDRFVSTYKDIYSDEYNIMSVVYWWKTLRLASNADNTEWSKVSQIYNAPFEDLEAVPTEEQLATFKPGDLIITGSYNAETQRNRYSHCAIYAGYYDDQHWVIQSSDACPTGPHIYNFSDFTNATTWKNRSHIVGVFRLNFVPAETYEMGAIEVYKKDSSGNPLAGAVFSVTNLETNEPQVLGPTDANGYAMIDDLAFGKYLVKETVFPAGYGPGDVTEWTVEVNEGTPQTIVINAVNKPLLGNVTAKKVDASGNPLSGVTFGVYSDQGCSNLLQSIVTGDNGIATATGLTAGTTVYVKETQTKNSNYELNTTVYSATIVGGSTVSVNGGNGIVNNWRNGTITVSKKNADGAPLAGAEFTAVNQNTKKSYVIGPTDANGAASATVPFGPYVITETKFPTNYKASSVSSWNVTVDANHVNVSFEAVNELKTGVIGIIKTDEAGNPLENAEFGLYSDAACTNQIATLKTDKDGKALSGQLECTKTFYLKEMKTPSEDYVLNTDVYSATVVENSTVWANNGQSVVNKLKDGTITVQKNDANGNGLAGALFTAVNRATKKSYTIGPTNASGHASATMPFGTYDISETTVPENYAVSGENKWTVTINHTAPSISFTAVNTLKKGTVGVKKQDEFGAVQPGVQFGLYSDAACTDLLETLTIDKNGQAVSSPLDCTKTYYLKETKVYNDNYVMDTKVYPVTVQADQTTWANNGNAIVNKLKDGYIRIKKTNPEGEPLVGAVFTAINQKSKAEYKIGPTDENGEAYAMMPYGTYDLEETTFPTNYRAGEVRKWTVTLDHSNPDQTVQAENVLQEGFIDVKKVDERGQPQYGAEFGIFADKACTQLIETITTKDTFDGAVARSGLLSCTKTYYVKETKAAHPDYEMDKTVYEVTVVAGRTVRVNNGQPIANYLKKGAIGVVKVDEFGQPLAGVVFGVYDDPTVTSQIATITTDEEGKAFFGLSDDGKYELDCRQNFWLKEIETKDNTYIPDTTVYEVPVVGDMIVYANNGDKIENYQKYWQLTVTKKDRVNGGLGAGEATICGAVYGLYDADGNLLEECTIDASGSFTTGRYVAGLGYYLQEIKAPMGYKLDETQYPLDNHTDPDKINVRLFKTQIDLMEDAHTATLQIMKYTEDPLALHKFDIPEKGSKFQVYLKAYGSYEEAAKAVDRRVCCEGTVDENGYVIWNTGSNQAELVYGTYVVHQVSGWEGRKLTEDFEIVVNEDTTQIVKRLNNEVYRANVTINKFDAESGKLIVSDAAGFSIKNVETGEYLTYKEPDSEQEITVFYTENGAVNLPMEIPYGEWEIIEVEAPDNYLPANETVKFVVDKDNCGNLSFDFANDPIMGILAMYKTGPQFSSVNKEESDFGDVHTPIFTEELLAGAVFDLIAAEDIITGDGVVHFKKGDVVETLTTLADGPVNSGPLYNGKYLVVEKTAPAGYIMSEDPIEIILDYDHTAETRVLEVNAENDRIRAQINLLKLAKEWKQEVNPETAEVGRVLTNIPGEGFTFGICAAEDFTALDGTVIKADSLIAVGTTDKDGKLTYEAQMPFGKFYVIELDAPEYKQFILSEEKYEIDLTVDENISGDRIVVEVNNGEPIVNDFTKFTVTINKEDLTTSKPVPGAQVTVKNEAGEIIYQAFTGEDGKLPDMELEAGKYTFEETIAPDAYIRETGIFEFTVNPDGTIEGSTTFTNEKTQVVLNKIDADTKKPLEGASIVVLNEDGKVVYAGISGEDGTIKISGLLVGKKYYAYERLAPDGYALNPVAHEFWIEADGTVKGATTIENTKTMFTINKVDQNGRPVEGAEFTLFDMRGEIIATGKSDANGKIVFEGFAAGTYQIYETKVPEGYTAKDVKIEIVNNGDWLNGVEGTTVTVENKAITKSPETGDNTNLALMFSAMTASAVGLAICLFLAFRKKKTV